MKGDHISRLPSLYLPFPLTYTSRAKTLNWYCNISGNFSADKLARTSILRTLRNPLQSIGMCHLPWLSWSLCENSSTCQHVMGQ